MRLELLEDRQLLATITVNTTADNATAGSTLSLRQAIEVSDGTLAVSALSTQEQAQVSGTVGGNNIIDFDIPKTDSGYDSATGVWTIALQSALPAVSTNAAFINGYSQPGAVENTLSVGDNAKLVIAIDGAFGGGYGLSIAQPSSQVSGLDIEKCPTAGVLITSPGNVQVSGCFIGTDATGETAAGNNNGVTVENSSNSIGGPAVADRNVISGNAGYGIFIPDQAANPLNVQPETNDVANNYIGIDAAGSKALANGASGVYDQGTNDVYGGQSAGEGNVISGNKSGGLKATGSILVEGNYVGTDATGNVGLGNGSGFGGITDEGSPGVAVSSTISNNVVSGNAAGGIFVSPGSQSQSSFTVANNLIGTNAAGTAAIGCPTSGLYLGSVENTTVTGNVISANEVGIDLSGFGPDVEHNVIQGNLIGTDRTGQGALGNTEYGMVVANAIGNTIGGPGPGQANVIAFNGGDAIYISAGGQDQVTQNIIFGNQGKGIDLVANGNDFMTSPQMTFTPGSGSNGTLSGTLTEAANTAYTVEIFSNPSVPTSGQEQGKTFVHDVTVNTDSSGHGSFSVTEPTGIYTATATDPKGDTSEFSATAGTQSQPQQPAASTTTAAAAVNPSTVGQPVTFTAVVTAPGFSGTPTGTVTFTIDGQAQTPVQLSVVGGQDEAQFATSTLTAGPHSVAAAYSGDSNVSPSSASLPTQTVNPASSHQGQPFATTITVVSSANPSSVGEPVTFTATVTAGPGGGALTGTVTFTIDGKAEAPVPIEATHGGDQAALELSTLAAGKHTLTATYSGDATDASSSLVRPLVQTITATTLAAPKVILVQRLGIHMQPTVVVLTFNMALDPVSATNLDNYVLVGRSGTAIPFKSVSYDASSDTVTLHPSERINLHHNYRLTVKGSNSRGIAGMDHTLLDGSGDGQPGSDFVTTLNWKNVVLSPAEWQKIHELSHAKPAGPLGHRLAGRKG